MTGRAAFLAEGTFAVAWSQTEADGVPSPRPVTIAPGVLWRWHGAAQRIGRPWGPLTLGAAEGSDALRARAARVARRLSGLAAAPADALAALQDEPPAGGMLLTDGYRAYPATVVALPGAAEPVVCFAEGLPPAGADLWVVRATLAAAAADAAAPQGGVICFTPGTRIGVPGGTAAIEDLRPGDLVETADNGPQPVLWTGRRRLTGARLYAMPHLRPVRIRAAAFGAGQPEGMLVVSPQHRLLVRGPAARSLWGIPEVLVAAADLVDDRRVTVDCTAREVTYVHVLFEAHQIVRANGIETESFHPAAAAPGSLDPADAAVLAGLVGDPAGYGDHARRPLSLAEAAILRHDLRPAA
ncbi:MAG: Hint domain-containing protein [Gemmobacter sp.]